jgi:phospholipid/cholesterol/gamma-HCH transport system substrate-binding protein
MTDKWQKILVGFLLICLLGVWLVWAHNSSIKQQKKQDFILYAYFSKTDGLNVGAPVRLSGLPIGRVFAMDFDEEYLVRATLAFDKQFDLSIDTSVSIETDGIFGSKHIELIPGADEELFVSGDTIAYTQDALLLDELLEKLNGFMANKKNKNEEKGELNEEESN